MSTSNENINTNETNVTTNNNSYLPLPIDSKYFGYLISGSSARILGATITSPLDTIKTRLQFSYLHADIKQYKNGWDAAKQMWKQEGKNIYIKIKIYHIYYLFLFSNLNLLMIISY
jgi:hypothetical protein